jgi:hypothetical protein
MNFFEKKGHFTITDSGVLGRCKGGRMLEAHLQHDFDTGEEEDQVRPARFHQPRGFLPDN